MKFKKYKKLILPILFCLVFTLFIFSNSMKGSQASNEDSNSVIALIKPMVDWLFDISDELLNIIVRKLAHFTEFCALGLSACSFGVLYKQISNKIIVGISAFYCLFVAVIDEFIQSFTGRTSSVVDVLIDFSGAIFGFIIVYLMNVIVVKVKSKK